MSPSRSANLVTPLYAHPDTEGQAHRRLLLLSYHFPPDPSIGARRWEKLLHFAAERGWGADVVMRWDEGRTLSPADRARLAQLPPGVRVYGVPLVQPAIAHVEARTAAWLRRIRETKGNAQDKIEAIPAAASVATNAPVADAAVRREALRWAIHTPRGVLRAYWAWLEHATFGGWGKAAARVAGAIAEEMPGAHRVVITSGPPHMIHDGGRRAAELAGLPLVMDMRDPWSAVEQLVADTASPLWVRLATRYEQRAVARSSLVVANTEIARRALEASYPSRQRDIITIMNGSDDDPIPASRRSASHTDRFVIAHAGTVYLDRNPRPLFQAAAKVIRELALTPEQFGLSFIGELEAVGGFPLADVARQEGIENYVALGPSLPYAQAMEFMADATMLLVMSGSNRSAIPAKVFECVRFEAWLLALSAPGSATALALQGTEADVVGPDHVDQIAAVLRRRYEEYRQGRTPPVIGASGQFSRRHQATRLLDAIEQRL